MSAKFVDSKILQRPLRMEAPAELGKNSVSMAIEAIDAGKLEEAKQLVRYFVPEGKGLHDLYCDWSYGWYEYIAKKYGEEALLEASRETQEPWLKGFCEVLMAMDDVYERVAWLVECMRAHRCGPQQMGDVTVIEEADRYVMEFDPCGSGGRMRRGDPVNGTPARTGPPYDFGCFKQGYPWTWGEKIPYYCVHCCVNQIRAIELAGYPLWITEYSSDPNAPCKWIVYKSPELIPEKYWTCVNKTKPASFPEVKKSSA